ncbi:MAG: heme A synthase [Opitutales bacterium]
MTRSSAFKPRLRLLCLFTLVPTALLITMGAHTTSILAGMAFHDWPFSNGSINPEGWLSDPMMFAEHSHRLLGALVGILAIALAVWTHRVEARTWVRALAWAFLGMVIFQGILGGMRVRFDQLNTGSATNVVAETLCVVHAVGAQIVVATLATLCLVQFRRYATASTVERMPGLKTLRLWGAVSCVLLLAQVAVGAVVRHIDAGLSIPYFPHATQDGALVPNYWNEFVLMNFLHRVGAVLVTVALFVFTWKLSVNRKIFPAQRFAAYLVAALLIAQIALGALTVWTHISAWVATAHLVIGAALVSSTWLLTFSVFAFPLARYVPSGSRLPEQAADKERELVASA